MVEESHMKNLGNKKSLTIATIAFTPHDQMKENVDRVIELIVELKESNDDIDLIIFGEMILSEYKMEKEYIRQNALNINSEVMMKLRTLCSELCINLTFGFSEEDKGLYYNSQILIDRTGRIISIHRKSNLTAGEKKVFKPGECFITFTELEGVKIALSICYDLFGSGCRSQLKEISPDLLIHSLADPQNGHFVTGVNGRLSTCNYVSANRFSKEGKTDFPGHIGIVSRAGKILELKTNKAQHIIKGISLEPIKNVIIRFLFQLSNNVLFFFHIIFHIKRVISYLRWNLKMKTQKKQIE